MAESDNTGSDSTPVSSDWEEVDTEAVGPNQQAGPIDPQETEAARDVVHPVVLSINENSRGLIHELDQALRLAEATSTQPKPAANTQQAPTDAVSRPPRAITGFQAAAEGAANQDDVDTIQSEEASHVIRTSMLPALNQIAELVETPDVTLNHLSDIDQAVKSVQRDVELIKESLSQPLAIKLEGVASQLALIPDILKNVSLLPSMEHKAVSAVKKQAKQEQVNALARQLDNLVRQSATASDMRKSFIEVKRIMANNQNAPLAAITQKIAALQAAMPGLAKSEDVGSLADSLSALHDQVAAVAAQHTQGRPVTAAQLDRMLTRAIATTAGPMHDAVEEVMQSAATKSMLANAVASGLGSLGSGIIVKAVVEAIKAPFTGISAGVEAAKNLAEGADAVTNSIRNMTEAANDVKQLVQDAAKVGHDLKRSFAETNTGGSAKSTGATAGQLLTGALEQQKFHDAKQKCKRAHIGDRTFLADTVATETVANRPPLHSAEILGTWFQVYAQQRIKYEPWHHFTDGNELQAQSTFSLYNRQGELRDWNTASTKLYHTMVNDATVEKTSVEWTAAIKDGELDSAALEPYMRGPNVADRFVQDVLNGKLHPADQFFIRNIAYLLNQQLACWDNTGLYAKALHWALCYAHCTERGIAMQPVDLEGVDVLWIDLTAAQGDWMNVEKGILEGRLAFVEQNDWTYTQENYAFLRWLSASGSRIAVADGISAPSSRYVTWPTIKIMILARRAAPAHPNNEVMSDATIYSYLSKMAALRGEYRYLVRALYVASCTNAGDHSPKGDAPRRVGFNFMLSPNTIGVTAPHDYNVLGRIIGIRRSTALNASAVWQNYENMPRIDRLFSCALAAGMVQAAVTTVCATFTIDRQSAVTWVGGGRLDSPALNTLISTLNTCSAIPDASPPRDLDNVMLVLAKTTAHATFAVRFPTSLFPGMEWLGSYGRLRSPQELQALQVYSEFAGQSRHPLRYDSLLGLINLAVLYPQEWGVFGHASQLDITKEFKRNAIGRNGWYSQYGSELYTKQALSANPYNFIPYGFQVVQALCQILTLANNRYFTIDIQPIDWEPAATEPAIGAPEHRAWAVPDSVTPDWGIAMYEPCSAATYDWRERQVLAYVLRNDQPHNDRVIDLSYRVEPDCLGLCRRDVDLPNPNYRAVDGGIGMIAAFTGFAIHGAAPTPVETEAVNPQ